MYMPLSSENQFVVLYLVVICGDGGGEESHRDQMPQAPHPVVKCNMFILFEFEVCFKTDGQVLESPNGP